MLLVGDEQVELGVLLNLHAEIIERLNGGIAGEEVLRTGTEGDDLQAGHADQSAGHRHEVENHPGHVLRVADRILGHHGLDLAQAEVVRAVEHAAVRVAAAVDQVVHALLGGGGVHDRAVKVLRDKRLGSLGAEVAEEHDESGAARGLHVLDGAEHILLVLHGDLALVDLSAELLMRGGDGGTAALRQGNDKAVAADGDEAQLDLGNVVKHSNFLPYGFLRNK